MITHAKWNASGMERHLNCTASVDHNVRDGETSEAAEEGTRAHELAEQLLRGENPPLTDELEENLGVYVGWIGTTQAKLYDSVRKIEHRMDHPELQDIGGTADCILIGNEIEGKETRLVCHVNDLKYGHHPVETHYNMQLLTYMLLAYRSDLAKTFKFNTDTIFRASIIQPRTAGERIDVWEVTVAELVAFETRIRLAQQSEPEYSAGHWCRYCRHKVECEAFSEQTQELAKQAFPVVEDDQITQAQVDRAKALWDLKPAMTNLFDDLEKWLIRAARQGHNLHGLKVIQSLGNRSYVEDDETVITKLRGRGLGKKLTTETKLMSPSKIEKVAKANDLDPAKVLKGLTQRKELGLKVVKESHYRPAVEFEKPTEVFEAIEDWSDDDLGSILDETV